MKDRYHFFVKAGTHCFVAMLLLTSCIKDESLEKLEASNELQSQSYRSMTAIVGKKLKNPYSLRNMKQAEKNLAIKGTAARIAENQQHWYVKFKPATAEDVKRLENDSLKLFDFPFDHELTTYPDCQLYTWMRGTERKTWMM